MNNTSKTSHVTFNTILRAKAFREGVADHKAGLPHRDVGDMAQKNIWQYEWGRQFAALFPNWTEKQLRPLYGKVNEEAVSQFAQAYFDKWILNAS